MDRKKVLLILTIITIFLCACPGCFLFVTGAELLGLSFMDKIADPSLWGTALLEGLSNGSWIICPGALIALIPLILFILWLVYRKKPSKPTGVSGNDPIPPAS